MSPVQTFLAHLDDVAAARALAELRPKDRKAALAELAEIEAAERTKLDGIEYEWELKKLPEDSPQRIEGLALWARHREMLERIRLVRTACLLGAKSIPREETLWTSHLTHPPILEVLLEAPPKWLPLSYDKLLKKFGGWGILDDSLVDALVAAGRMDSPPADSGYHWAWDYRIHGEVEGCAVAANEWIRARPGFMETQARLWLQSRVTKAAAAGVGEPWDDGRDEFGDTYFRSESGEKVAFTALLMQIATPEQRLGLARALLEALRDCTSDYVASRSVGRWEKLGLSPEEQLAVLEALLAILESPAAPVVKFGCKQLGELASQPGFDPERLAVHLPTALLHASKPVRKAAVDLARSVQKHHSDSVVLASALASAAADLEPVVRKAYVALVKQCPASGMAGLSAALAPFSAEIPNDTRKGLEQAGCVIDTADRDAVSVPAPEPVETHFPALVPAGSVDDVAHLAAGVLVEAPDPLEVEMLIDGLLRFAPTDAPRLAAVLDPLVKRARRFHEGSDESSQKFSRVSILASEWILSFSSEGRPSPAWILRPSDPPETVRKQTRVDGCRWSGVMDFLIDCFGELMDLASSGRKGGLLCLPEFGDGSISPDTLVTRFNELRASGGSPGHRELVLALARCDLGKPCGVDVEGEDEAAQVIRFLLTGSRPTEVSREAWWLTAARAREPLADFSKDPFFAAFDQEDEADWTRPACYARLPEESRDWRCYSGGLLATDLPIWPPSDRLFPLQHQNHLDSSGIMNWTAEIRWRYALTPHHLDCVILRDLLHFSEQAGLSYKTAERAADAVAMEISSRRPPLRHPMRVLLLRTITVSKERLRVCGVDLAHDAIEDGRFGSVIEELGALFQQILMCEPPGTYDGPDVRYLGKSLRELASRSLLARSQVGELLARGLAAGPERMPKALPGLLELALELFQEMPAEKLPDPLSDWPNLPSGKAKTLAKKIAALREG